MTLRPLSSRPPTCARLINITRDYSSPLCRRLHYRFRRELRPQPILHTTWGVSDRQVENPHPTPPSGHDILKVYFGLRNNIFSRWVIGIIHAWVVIIYFGVFQMTPQERRRARRRVDEAIDGPRRRTIKIAGVRRRAPPPLIPPRPQHQTDVTEQDFGDFYAQDAQDIKLDPGLEPSGPLKSANPPYARDDAWDYGPPKPAHQSGFEDEQTHS